MSDSEQELIPGLAATRYIYDRAHRLLAEDAYKTAGPNIGRDGSNLTIAFLSLNRSPLSLKLLKSIRQYMPAFAGQVLVIDNDSEEKELKRLRACRARLPYEARIVELGRNFGVAGGRNRMMAYIETEWVLCLDNDIYFIANPLEVIQNDIAVLGCHFLNLPLLDHDGQTIFAKGGHLYPGLELGELRIGVGSVLTQTTENRHPCGPFLSTFLFGGACVLKKATFEALGGYDEGMFIGFEDIDFSIRLFQQGLKVGNTGYVSLVHDHSLPGSNDDVDYERLRFSHERLKKSAEYLESKHGMKVWNTAVDEWLKVRQRELGIVEQRDDTQPAEAAATPTPSQGKPKIALIVDTDTWAFWNISQQLVRHLGHRFDFRVIPTAVIDNVIHVFLMARDCDLVHMFWREYLGLLREPHCRVYVEWLGSTMPEFMEKVVKTTFLSTCVYDHLHLDARSLRQRLPIYRDLIDAYYVGSERLRKIYSDLPGYPPPRMVLEDGVDPELFYPLKPERFADIGTREIVIGWTGNSNWAHEFEDFKGVQTILKPAVEQLSAAGLPLRLHLADRAEGGPMIPHNQMLGYYSQIDLYVCTSKIEGTPNPVLEAMACGVPVISTDVGIVRQAFGPRQSDFILEERTIECLKIAIRRLVASPDLFRELSQENLDYIQRWDWRLKTQGFGDYFDSCLRQKAERPR